ncbi:MAG: carboxypeptidase regulatory-like domain-containing protein [Terriglobales bacterium]|jgi:outer membrane receptor protein involved in Fe transport
MRAIRYSFLFPLAFAIASFYSIRVDAQVGTGTISGAVMDPSGAVVVGALVSITNSQTGVVTSATTNSQGRYVVPDLIVGAYDVQAAKQGFEAQVIKQVLLTVGANFVVDCKLAVGQKITALTVTEFSQVDTTTAEISALISRGQMENLPLNGRNFEQLILLAPGVQAVTTGVQGSFYGRAPSYSISGSRPEGQELLLDGATIQAFWRHGAGNSIIGTSLGVDGIGEFQLLTNSYSARFGGSGSVMNATTRSGTNSFHGSAYDFLRNSVFDARNYFNQSPAPQDAFRQNQFGGTLGGPIVKGRMFFFANYEGIRRQLGETVIGFVPNDNTRQGVVPCAYATDLPCNSDGTATVPVNSASQAILNLYPKVSSNAVVPGSPVATVALQGSQPANEDYGNIRWDYHGSEKDNFFARYILDDGSLTDPFASPLGLYPEQSRGRNQYLTLGYNKLINPSVLNDARFSFVRTNMRAFTSVSNPALQFFSFYGEDRQDGNIGVPGFSQIGPSGFTPDHELQNTFSLSDGIFWAHGKHSIEAGLEFRRLQSPVQNGFFNDLGWTFPNLESFLEGQPVSPTDPPITFLGALPGKDNSARSFREWDLFPYIQDTWRVSRSLTLTFGLRYDFISNPTEVHNELCAFIAPSDPSTKACTPVSHVFPSNPSRKSLDPRVGIAWDPFKDGKTSIHAGAGVFHDPIQVRNYHAAYIFSAPYQTALSLCFFELPPCSYPVPFQGPTQPIPTIGEALEYDPGTTPFVVQYNFGVQRLLGKDTVLNVSYVGSRGYNLLVQNDTNPPIPTLVNGQPNFLNAPRENPNLGAIAFGLPDGSSWYNSLQVYLTRNVGRTWQFQGAYTYSKCLDYGSIAFALESSNSAQQARSDPYNLARDKGRCDFDVTHNFTGSATYFVPLHGNRIVEGWQLSMIAMAHSGNPFSVQDGFDRVGLNDAAGTPGERPNLVPGRSNNPILGRVDQWYDPSAFALQGAGFIGNLGRNTLIGPKFFEFDMALAKTTRVKENISLEFRVEAFDLLNRPNFGLPGQFLYAGVDQNDNGIPNSTAGQITNTVSSARQLQFAFKVRF